MKGSKCLFCRSYKSHLRIVTPDGVFDEVACRKHIDDLYSYANQTLGKNNGIVRMHETSTGILFRGSPYPALEYEIWCNGSIHYTRSAGRHPDIAEAIALIEHRKKSFGRSSYFIRPVMKVD
jgi:hypothetical protein